MIYYSHDGITWNKALDTAFNKLSSSFDSIICYGNSKYILANEKYIYCLKKDDNNNFKLVKDSSTTVPVSNAYWRSVCYGNGKFVIVGYVDNATDRHQYILYSTDGITWP